MAAPKLKVAVSNLYKPMDGTASAIALAERMNRIAKEKGDALTARGTNYLKNMMAETRQLQLDFAAYFREHPKANVDDVILWEKKDRMPSGRPLVSRRNEMNALKGAAIAVPQVRLEALYDIDKGPVKNKAAYVRASRFLAENPRADDAAIIAYLKGGDNGPLAETFGGFMVEAMNALTNAYRASPTDFARYQKWLAPLQKQYVVERQANMIPTAKELYGVKRAQAGVDFEATIETPKPSKK